MYLALFKICLFKTDFFLYSRNSFSLLFCLVLITLLFKSFKDFSMSFL